jgi:hypothetical protein
MRTLVLALTLTAVGCGDSSSQAPATTPDAGTAVDAASGAPDAAPQLGSVQISPRTLLLTKVGDGQDLVAQVFDPAGQQTAATVTWTSSRPEQVSVDGNGHIMAQVVPGSAVITATAPQSSPGSVAVVVAAVPDGAILVDDAAIVTGPDLVDPTADFVPGTVLRATLHGIDPPAVGALVLGRGEAPLQGRVQAVTAAANGDLVVDLALVALGDIFHGLDIDLEGPFAADVAGTGPAQAAIARLPIGASQTFNLGPLLCTASFTLNLISGDFSYTKNLNLQFIDRINQSEDGEFHEITLEAVGTVDLDLVPKVLLMAGYAGNITCDLKLWERQIPLPGPVGAVLGFQIPVGLRGVVSGSAQTSPLTIKGEIVGRVSVTAGVSWTDTGGAVDVNKFDHNLQFKPDIQLPGADFPVILGAGVAFGLYTQLQFGVHQFTDARLIALEADALAHVDASVAAVGTQLADPAYASNYDEKSTIDIKVGNYLSKLAGKIAPAVNFIAKGASYELPNKAVSPSGTFKVDMTDIEPEKVLTLTVDLDPSTLKFMGIDNVTGVNFYHTDQNQSKPVILSTASAAPGQTHFTATWTPTNLDIGTHHFWAATETKLLPILPLEVAVKGNDWTGTLTISMMGMGKDEDGITDIMLTASGTINFVTDPSSMDSNTDIPLDSVGVTGMASRTDTSVDMSSLTMGSCEYQCTTTTVFQEDSTAPSVTTGLAGFLMIENGSGNYGIIAGLPSFDTTSKYTATSSCTSNGGDLCPPMDGTIEDDGTSILDLNPPVIVGTGPPNPDRIMGSLSTDVPAGAESPPTHYDVSWDFSRH